VIKATEAFLQSGDPDGLAAVGGGVPNLNKRFG
jgi:hypothetical protein